MEGEKLLKSFFLFLLIVTLTSANLYSQNIENTDDDSFRTR